MDTRFTFFGEEIISINECPSPFTANCSPNKGITPFQSPSSQHTEPIPHHRLAKGLSTITVVVPASATSLLPVNWPGKPCSPASWHLLLSKQAPSTYTHLFNLLLQFLCTALELCVLVHYRLPVLNGCGTLVSQRLQHTQLLQHTSFQTI